RYHARDCETNRSRSARARTIRDARRLPTSERDGRGVHGEDRFARHVLRNYEVSGSGRHCDSNAESTRSVIELSSLAALVMTPSPTPLAERRTAAQRPTLPPPEVEDSCSPDRERSVSPPRVT